MVELKISGCCKSCRNIDLVMTPTVYYDGEDFQNVYSIRCIHEPVCAKLEKELSDGKTDENI